VKFHCCLNNYVCEESMSGLVSAVFVFTSSLHMTAPLSNCSVAEKREVIRCVGGQKAFKHQEPIYECGCNTGVLISP